MEKTTVLWRKKYFPVWEALSAHFSPQKQEEE